MADVTIYEVETPLTRSEYLAGTHLTTDGPVQVHVVRIGLDPYALAAKIATEVEVQLARVVDRERAIYREFVKGHAPHLLTAFEEIVGRADDAARRLEPEPDQQVQP